MFVWLCAGGLTLTNLFLVIVRFAINARGWLMDIFCTSRAFRETDQGTCRFSVVAAAIQLLKHMAQNFKSFFVFLIYEHRQGL